LITFIGRSQMMGSSKSTVIISCINVHILFSNKELDVLMVTKSKMTIIMHDD